MEEKRNGVNWPDVIIKVLFLVALVFILLFFFPASKNNSSQEEKNDNKDVKNENVLSKFEVLLDKIFRDNLNEMKYSAKSYFTKERMPSDGEEKTLTLQEMYDLNLLLPLIDKDNKACSSEESFVKVTKDNQEYKMKITLTCGSTSKTITEIIGCYDFCENNSCGSLPEGSIATNLQYQFVRENVKTTYSCPKGYVKKGSYCYTTTFGKRINAEEIISEDETIIEEAKKNEDEEVKKTTEVIKTETETTYTCPEGYTKSEDGKKCSKVEIVDPTIGEGYTCPEGYTLNGNYCYLKKEIKPNVQNTYKCSSGYKLASDGKTCYKYDYKKYVENNEKAECPSGYKSSGNRCKKVYTTTAKKVAKKKTTTVYKAPSGYSKCGNRYCKSIAASKKKSTSVKTIKSYSPISYVNTSSKKVVPLGCKPEPTCGSGCIRTVCRATQYLYSYSYSCPSSYPTRSGSRCYSYKNAIKSTKTSTYYVYECPSGYTRNGTKCTKTEYIGKFSSSSLSCPKGYERYSNTQCRKTVTKSATKSGTTTTCPIGYDKVDDKCVFSLTKPATPVEGEKVCPEGFVKDNDKCKKETIIDSTIVPGEIKYSCPEGFDLSDDKKECYKYELVEGDYYCENSDAILDGKQCIVTIPGGEVIGYKCPAGYIKDGNTCYKKITKKVGMTSKSVITYQYKWSSLKSIPGWTRTGKTRSA